MSLRGQLLELKNAGRYVFDLVIGITDSVLPCQPSIDTNSENTCEGNADALSATNASVLYECRLDLSDRTNPTSFPQGDLLACMELYHANDTPVGLSDDGRRCWQIAYIVDAIISELISTDAIEVIYGDEWEMTSLVSETNSEAGLIPCIIDENIPSPRAFSLGRNAIVAKCPDCGVQVKAAVITPDAGRQLYTCYVCGRHFDY